MTCFTYVFPCAWEDHCKIGFSRDPLARISQLHPRWFEFFDLQQGLLVEVETEREARDLELALRRPLSAHRAPQPLTIVAAAGGHTEWVRGARAQLLAEVDQLRSGGYRVHAPFSDWLHDALLARAELMYDWSSAQLSPDELEHPAAGTVPQRVVRDALDAYAALGIALAPWLPQSVWHWYRALAGRDGLH